MDGALVVDKPEGCTSHDVVNRVRRILQTRRIGHLGTLDPLATGVLPLLVNRATRLAQYFRRNDKQYEAVVKFGVATDSFDRDGAVTSSVEGVDIDRRQLEEALDQFRGTYLQTPPPVSAKKVQGVPAYKLARKNITVELEPVEVTVHSLDLIDSSSNSARLRIHCSGGTYVRRIVHDLGMTLGCGAIVDQLRRTASGDFTGESARTLDELTSLAADGRVEDAIVPAGRLLPHIPAETVDALTAGQIRQGRDFRVSPFRNRGGEDLVKAVTMEGELIAIGKAVLPNTYHPVLVL